MIDLLQIPGTWRRPNPPEGSDHHPFDDSPKDAVLYTGGEADWQFTAKGPWSSSGHWKITNGDRLSIFAIYPDPVAIARGDEVCDFFYRLISIQDDRMLLQVHRRSGWVDQIWTRIASGKAYPTPTSPPKKSHPST